MHHFSYIVSLQQLLFPIVTAKHCNETKRKHLPLTTREYRFFNVFCFYCRRGSLVTEDGKKSEWLYFIKSVRIYMYQRIGYLSLILQHTFVALTYILNCFVKPGINCLQGSCEVLKKLRNVKARKSCQIKRKPDPITEIVLPELGGGPGKLGRSLCIFSKRILLFFIAI